MGTRSNPGKHGKRVETWTHDLHTSHAGPWCIPSVRYIFALGVHPFVTYHPLGTLPSAISQPGGDAPVSHDNPYLGLYRPILVWLRRCNYYLRGVSGGIPPQSQSMGLSGRDGLAIRHSPRGLTPEPRGSWLGRSRGRRLRHHGQREESCGGDSTAGWRIGGSACRSSIGLSTYRDALTRVR